LNKCSLKKIGAQGVVQALQNLLRKCKTLNSKPSIVKNEIKIKAE
jgi:hypothetical protein